ncbi:hypothetical protein I4U23_015869 [Adineta vaga]|nr:hypothetical protein I4U23_015869 [Adineta vaga]
MSFALIVLIIFGFWFGSVYIKQYRIETTTDAYFSCDHWLRRSTKVINQTEDLYTTDLIIYSGIWIPTMIIKLLNDRIAYGQQGTYIRYLLSKQVICFIICII